MSFTSDAFHLTLLLLVAVLVVGILAFILITRLKRRREKRKAAAITDAIVDYFRKSGVGVAVGCISPSHNDRFTAFIESEPMKRFRLSHIIEMTIREHVRKTCGLELEKIYWRFPVIKEARPEAAGGEAKPRERAAQYINEGLDHYRHIPQPEVEELPWEHFEEVITIDRNTRPAGENTEPGKTAESRS